MIITIDGPTASGKSTVAQLIAQNLNIFYLNSGYLYRTYGYLLLKKGLAFEYLETIDLEAAKNLIDNKDIKYVYENGNMPKILYKSEDITSELKQKNVDMSAARVGKNIDLRTLIKDLQYKIVADYPRFVADGRDMGTKIFPHADYKFYLTASITERAKRWQKYQQSNDKTFSLEQAENIVSTRDHADMNRQHSSLKPDLDYTMIDNSILTIEETLKFILNLINK